MAEADWKRIHGCIDVTGRRRDLAVSLDDEGFIVVHTPPGEVAKLHPATIDALIDDLRAARLAAFSRRDGE